VIDDELSCLVDANNHDQFTGQKHLHADMPAATKLEDGDEVTEEIVQESLRLALGWMSALQAEDGHWPGDFSGIMYILPFWVRVIIIPPMSQTFNYISTLSLLIVSYMRASYLPNKICFHLFFHIFVLDQIFALHITGSIDVVLSKEHKREICRHIYNHQARQPYYVP